MIHFIRSARPTQWTKNLLLFAGIIFSGLFQQQQAATKVLLLFGAFCLVSSAGYIVNDLLDKDSDAKHPRKKLRPIASGQLTTKSASAFALILLFSGIALAYTANIYALASIGVYGLNQIFYSVLARRIPVLDVFVISFGFVIRAVAGALVIQVYISQWLLLCTLMLALFLGFAKRRHELLSAAESRTSLSGYSQSLLDQLIGVTASGTVIAYCIYAIQSPNAIEHPLLALTIPFPIFGVFRYLHITYVKQESGSPDTALLRDPWMWGTILLWGTISLFAMANPNLRLISW